MCLRRFRVRRIRRRRLNLLSAHFLEGYLADFDQTSHKYSLGHGAVQALRWLTLTYFSRSNRGQTLTFFEVFVHFLHVFCLDFI